VSFVLVDPGLIMPPSRVGVAAQGMFWARLIEWSDDRRIKLGRESFQIVIEHFTARGWPDVAAENCPQELRSLARVALNRLLSSVREPLEQPADIPQLTPRYVNGADTECALALDLGAVWADLLTAVATDERHWETRAQRVAVRPPPPESVSIIREPKQVLPQEIDARVAEFLAAKRLVIVGALRDDRFLRQLCRTFALDTEQVRWVESEPGREPQLSSLKALAGHRDIVCCILGAPGQLGLGHAGSEKAIRLATNRGAEVLIVDRPNRLLSSLRERFGD
jgi:hypothetical protein